MRFFQIVLCMGLLMPISILARPEVDSDSESAKAESSTTSSTSTKETTQLKTDAKHQGMVQLNGKRWQKCGPGLRPPVCLGKTYPMNWWQARDYCKQLKLYNQKWRLPTTAELESLMKQKAGLDRAFPGSRHWTYWTSEKYNGSDRAARVVDLQRQSTGGELLWKSAYVRCIAK